MRFAAYISKRWLLLLLAVIGLFALGIVLVWGRMSVHHQIIVSILIGVAGALVLLKMLAKGPVVVADENGLTVYPRFYDTIPWSAIQTANHIPRTEKFQIGGRTRTNTSFTEAWRPVDVYISGMERYARRPSLITKAMAGIQSSRELPGCFRLRIDLTGTTGDSAELMKVLDYYLAENRNG